MAIHELFSYICVKNAGKAIDFYKAAFGATEKFRLTEPSGRIGHAELLFGKDTLMLADEFPEMNFLAPAPDSPRTFVLTFLASILIQNLQGYVISPLVEGDQLDIHPLLVFVAVLVGAALGGAIGAFVAVPAAAIVDLVVREVVIPWRRAQLRGAAAAGRRRPTAHAP